MKQSVFMSVVLITSIVVSAAIFYGVFGSPSNLKTPEMHTPSNIMGFPALSFQSLGGAESPASFATVGKTSMFEKMSSLRTPAGT